jgi:hypothetical protein
VAPWLETCKCSTVEGMPWQTKIARDAASDTRTSPEDAPQCPPNAAPVVFETLSTLGETAHTMDALHSDGPASAGPCRRGLSMLCRLEQPAVLIMPLQAVQVQNDTSIQQLSHASQAAASTAILTTAAPLKGIDQSVLLASSRCTPTAPATPLANWGTITGHANGLCFKNLCTPGSNAQSVVADTPCGPSHTHPAQAPDEIGTTPQTQLVLMDHLRVPDDMLEDQPWAWRDTPTSAEELRVPPRLVGHVDASQRAGDPAAETAQWALFLIAYTLLTAAVALSCVRCGLSALVCCAATGPVGLMFSGTVCVLCLLEVRFSL